MMALETPEELAVNPLDALLQALRQETSADTLTKLRAASWDRFVQRGHPAAHDEVFRYVGLRKFFQTAYVAAERRTLTPEAIAPHILPGCEGSVVVFVNGFFVPELSCMEALPSVSLLPLSEAHRSFSTFLTNQWQRSLQGEQDPWALVNAAVHPAGAFVYIPPRTTLTAPLQILSLVDTGEAAMLLLPRFHMFVGTGSQATTVTTTAVLSGSRYALLPAADIAIEDNGRLELTDLVLHDSRDLWHAATMHFTLKRNSYLETVHVTHGGQGLRHDYRVDLLGENSEAYLNGLCLLDGHSEAHVHSLIEHQAPHCRSLQLFKNVLHNSAKASFEGKIYVDKEAQKTDAFQLNNNLLLSEGTQVNSKPNLEIFADDVKASHGATMGQLDHEQLFYLLARGIDKATAHHILVQGFCRAVLDKIHLAPALEQVKNTVQRYIAAI